MKLLLSGGGDPEQVVELDKFFANYVNKEKVLYIPVAMDKFPYEDCLNWFRETYKEYNITNIEMLTDLSKDVDLNEYKAIFIGGGNTFKLLNEIKDTNFDIKLKKYLENDGFVYGGSAGAIIFGSSIDTASHADKNYIGLEDLTGLNVLNGKKIWCHYNPKSHKKEIEKIDGDIIVLYEESGIFYDGNIITSIGKNYIMIESK